MRGRGKTGLHTVALAALFTVGNSLIRYPWRENAADMPILFLLTVGVSVLPACFLYPLFCRLLRGRLAGRRGRLLAVIPLSAFLLTYAMFSAYRCFSDYVPFVTERILPHHHRVLLAAAFLGVAAWISETSKRTLDGFALLSLIASTVSVLLLFFVGIPRYDLSLLPSHITLAWSTAQTALPILVRETLLPLILLTAYVALATPRQSKGSLALGIAVGCGLLLLCVLQTLLTFGAQYASSLTYPYSFAVRILSVGPYFVRLEGVSYLLDYLACLVRCALCLGLVKRLTARFFPRLRLCLPLLLAPLMLLFFCLGA